MLRPLLIVLMLCACNTPSPGFLGASQFSFDYGGMRFKAYRKGNRVEVLRVSPALLPTFPEVAANALPGVAAATGCTPVWAQGDQALMEVGLSCNGAKAPKRKLRPKTVYCDLQLGPSRSGMRQGDMICEA